MLFSKPAILLLVGASLISACKKDGLSGCESLLTALQNIDTTAIKWIINLKARAAGRVAENSGFPGAKDKLDKLAAAIDGGCGLQASIQCVMCIHTMPPQTEMKIVFPTNGSLSYQIIDLYSEEGKFVEFRGMHQ